MTIMIVLVLTNILVIVLAATTKESFIFHACIGAYCCFPRALLLWFPFLSIIRVHKTYGHVYKLHMYICMCAHIYIHVFVRMQCCTYICMYLMRKVSIF